jgi:hypothetical protein
MMRMMSSISEFHLTKDLHNDKKGLAITMRMMSSIFGSAVAVPLQHLWFIPNIATGPYLIQNTVEQVRITTRITSWIFELEEIIFTQRRWPIQNIATGLHLVRTMGGAPVTSSLPLAESGGRRTNLK